MFTAFDGSIVAAGELVASVKVAPHVVDEAAVGGRRAARRATAAGRSSGSRRSCRLRVAVVVKESVRSAARERFEASVRAKVESLGSAVVAIVYADDGRRRSQRRWRRVSRGRGRVDVVLTAGGGRTDPLDPFFVAIDALGGRLVRRGVPAHPGSMLWLGRVGRTGRPRPADVRRVLEGDGRGPAAAAAAHRRAAQPADSSRRSATAAS